MDKNVLLVGRKGVVVDDFRKNLAVRDANHFSAITLEEVREVLDEHPIDAVIMGRASTSRPALGSSGTSSRRVTRRACT